MNATPAGPLLGRIWTLATLFEKPGAALTTREIDLEEWNALQVLWSERERHARHNHGS